MAFAFVRGARRLGARSAGLQGCKHTTLQRQLTGGTWLRRSLRPNLPVQKRRLATAAEARVDQNDGMSDGAAVVDGGIDSHQNGAGKSRQLWQDFSYRLAHTSRDMFAKRHIGPDTKDTAKMLASLSPAAQSLDDFVAQVIPPDVLSARKLQLDSDRDINIQDDEPRPETRLGYLEKEVARKAQDLSRKNVVANNFIGLGYYGTHTPDVIKQNILQNPAWYTSYTPYQPEISQGRLESLLNFQTMVSDLTGLAISNASLLDEGTAAAEAMTLSVNALPSSRAKGKDKTFVVSDGVNPHTVAVLRGRAEGFDVNVVIENVLEPDFEERLSSFGDGLVGVMVQYPDVAGRMHAFKDLADLVHAKGGLLSCATDLLALTHYTPPGEWGADIAFGNAQRFGVPLGNGGPHAAFFAVTEKYKRKIPGRLVGVSKDRLGGRALRLALQTREQHIRREKATSNVCTAQALLANMSAMYAVYHGAPGLRHIAEHAHGMACTVQHMARIYGWEVDDKKPDFDTVTIGFERGAVTITRELNDAPRAYVTNVRPLDSRRIAISCDETTTKENVVTLFQALLKAARHNAARYQPNDASYKDLDPRGYLRGSNVSKVFDVAQNKYRKNAVEEFRQGEDQPSKPLRRTSHFLTHPVFNTHHSETELLRYMHHLQSKDLSLVHSMIPLGSCTMKLNGATEMSLITQPRWADIHPRAPETQTRGYEELIKQLSHQLATITAMDAVSLQPNSGAQGEFTGLRVIRKYHESNGQANRDICLIPVSAHGTNPASAAMAGMRVVPIKCDTKTGNLDTKDLEEKCAQYSDQLAAMMITYPSTYGVFEPQIKRVCEIVHAYGGQVYMDGANMNAQIGLCAPGEIGADVCHLNLHKTFCIPHGGGGPGVGPICVKQHLAGYLPSTKYSTKDTDNPPVSSAPFGSASILPISWAYNLLMGSEGLKHATKITLLSANYLLAKLKPHYPILYTNEHGRCAHEFILDARPFRESAGIEAIDIAKRLQDYGFHAPTMSWPVPNTLMIEPTESESLEELDRFVEALVSIREEIREVEEGKAPKQGNVLKMAPHPIVDIIEGDGEAGGKWERAYSREKAAYPLPWLREKKFWPSVARVDDAYGDTNLFCTCPPVEDTTGGGTMTSV